MTVILGIESSCDDTSAAILKDGMVLTNIIASQKVHEAYGGVVPELASRAHQQNIIPVVSEAIKKAGIAIKDIDAVAFTRGPGLLGSLLVGTSFAKGFAIANHLPMIEVNHLQAHILANFIKEPGVESRHPSFPFLTLLVSGGNSQLIVVRNYLDMEMIGQTIDDAAGEAFDKCAKVMGLPYPGGPVIDRLAKEGNPERFVFNKPQIPGLDYSFSGLKTSFLYFLRDELKKNPDFIQENQNDLCASLQKTVIDILMSKLKKPPNKPASDRLLSEAAFRQTLHSKKQYTTKPHAPGGKYSSHTWAFPLTTPAWWQLQVITNTWQANLSVWMQLPMPGPHWNKKNHLYTIK